MQITLGDSDQIVAMVELAMDVVRKMKEKGLTKELSEYFTQLMRELHATDTAMDSAAYQAYRNSGMSSNEAIQLLLARRMQRDEIAASLGKAVRSRLQ